MNLNHIDLFKNHFDVFLLNIPDQPRMTGLGSGAETNKPRSTIGPAHRGHSGEKLIATRDFIGSFSNKAQHLWF